MQFQNEALYYNFKSDANTHESYPKPLCIENANSLNTTFTLHLLVPCWLFLCAVCLCRIWLKMKWSRWQCHSSILLAGQIMVPQTLAVNFLRLASFSSLPPPVGMVLAPSLYIAGVIHGGTKWPTQPPPPPLPQTHTHSFFTVLFLVKYYVAAKYPALIPIFTFSGFPPVIARRKKLYWMQFLGYDMSSSSPQKLSSSLSSSS